MKRLFFIAVLGFAFLLWGGAALSQQQGSAQGQGPQGQGWFCPWCGQQYGQGQGMYRGGQRMGPGMHGYQGRGMGPGMMRGYQGRGMGPGMMRGNQGRGMGPGMQGYQGRGMGPGMHGYQGQGMGPGMMRGNQGRGMGPGMRQERWGRGQYGPSRQQQQQQQQMGPLEKNTARSLAENYVAGNPNLKVGKVTEKEDSFVATVVTQDGSMVEKLLIDKETGWMKKQY